ncbi:MAG: cysteine desulfurase [Bacilli bacterium]|nr:cysteine desulfurase [Bacilli bacterium]
MIYLDYSATTPVLPEVLDSYIQVTKDFIGNANSIHNLGVKSKELLIKATVQISDILSCSPKEIIYTSGASESNTFAIMKTVEKYQKRGKHIVTSYLEHKSVLETMDYLKSIGFEISYVKLLENGQIDLEDLEKLIREDTILVSICAVNSEVGFKAPLKTIKQIINKKKSSAVFHSDMTQALGKRTFSLADVDLASFSSHKIYAPKGIGILYKKKDLILNPMIFGTTENAPFRGGTPALPLIVSFSKAMRIMNENFEKNLKKVETLKKNLIKGLSEYDVQINSNDLCVPHIVNVSLKKIKSETFVRALEKEGVCISTNTACSSLEESTVLKALTNDKNISTTSIRISISHLTTNEEIERFLVSFKRTYESLLLK